MSKLRLERRIVIYQRVARQENVVKCKKLIGVQDTKALDADDEGPG